MRSLNIHVLIIAVPYTVQCEASRVESADAATLRLSISRSPSLVNKPTAKLVRSNSSLTQSAPSSLFSFLPLHTWLKNAPVWPGGHRLTKPTEPHHPQKQRWDPEVTEVGPFCYLAPPWNSVHNKCKQSQLGDQSIQSEVTGRSKDF